MFFVYIYIHVHEHMYVMYVCMYKWSDVRGLGRVCSCRKYASVVCFVRMWYDVVHTWIRMGLWFCFVMVAR